MYEIGEELIYRLRDDALSERVRVIEIDTRKKAPRYVIEFLEGDKTGHQENIPGKRLRGLWRDIEEYDALMDNWKRIDSYTLTDAEESAVEQVFLLLIPTEAAEYYWGKVHSATCIHDVQALQKIIGISVDSLRSQTPSFDLDGDLIVSPEGTLMIAEYACRISPMTVLDAVLEEEKESRHLCKYGKSSIDFNNRPYTTSPEREYEWYLKHVRPTHELLRSWCGQRAATLQERLGAAEAENRRLEELIYRLFDEMKRHGHTQAINHLIRGFEEDRITPENFRPVVDRPLRPAEIPVQYVTGPRRWGY